MKDCKDCEHYEKTRWNEQCQALEIELRENMADIYEWNKGKNDEQTT